MTAAIQHNSWATLRLIDFVRRLSPEQHALTVPGTYGPIYQTLGHLVGAEQYYIYRLTGERAETAPDAVDLDELERRVRWNADQLEALLRSGFDEGADTHPNPRDPRMPTMGEMLAQLLWHAAEHRAQVATTLGAHGIEPPDIAGWAFAARRPGQ